MVAANQLCLRKEPQSPVVTQTPSPLPALDDEGGKVLACAHCLHEVTTSAERVSVGGSHDHTRLNPEGMRFHIGCFARALGCMPVGPASTYWSWFSGYSWQVELCGQCRVQLGWLFRSGDGVFHGLILELLIELDQDTRRRES